MPSFGLLLLFRIWGEYDDFFNLPNLIEINICFDIEGNVTMIFLISPNLNEVHISRHNTETRSRGCTAVGL